VGEKGKKTTCGKNRGRETKHKKRKEKRQEKGPKMIHQTGNGRDNRFGVGRVKGKQELKPNGEQGGGKGHACTKTEHKDSKLQKGEERKEKRFQFFFLWSCETTQGDSKPTKVPTRK